MRDENEADALELIASFAEKGRAHAAMAVANDALSDDDPRKITREKIEMIRAAANSVADEVVEGSHRVTDLRAFADALESYLPPESDRG